MPDPSSSASDVTFPVATSTRRSSVSRPRGEGDPITGWRPYGLPDPVPEHLRCVEPSAAATTNDAFAEVKHQ